jgi:hypothetical protein
MVSYDYVPFTAIRYNRKTNRSVQQSSRWKRVFHSGIWKVYTAVMCQRHSVNNDIGLLELSMSRILLFYVARLTFEYWLLMFHLLWCTITMSFSPRSMYFLRHTIVTWISFHQLFNGRNIIKSNQTRKRTLTWQRDSLVMRLVSFKTSIPFNYNILEHLRTLHTDLFHFIYFPSMNDKHIERFDWKTGRTMNLSRQFHC